MTERMDFFNKKNVDQITEKIDEHEVATNTSNGMDKDYKQEVDPEEQFDPAAHVDHKHEKKRPIQVPESIYYKLYGVKGFFGDKYLYDTLERVVDLQVARLKGRNRTKYNEIKEGKYNQDHINY